jgi:hypothetical protein
VEGIFFAECEGKNSRETTYSALFSFLDCAATKAQINNSNLLFNVAIIEKKTQAQTHLISRRALLMTNEITE